MRTLSFRHSPRYKRFGFGAESMRGEKRIHWQIYARETATPAASAQEGSMMMIVALKPEINSREERKLKCAFEIFQIYSSAMIKIYDRRERKGAKWRITYAAAPQDFTVEHEEGRGNRLQGAKSIYQDTRKGLGRKIDKIRDLI